MEQVHQTHKDTNGWVGVLKALRAAFARDPNQPRHVVTPWSLRSYDDWTA